MNDKVKTIKGVNAETWADFKALAAKKNVSMGNLLALMIMEYKRRSDEFWDCVLNTGRILSDKEADDMLKLTKKLRKERGFRNALDF